MREVPLRYCGRCPCVIAGGFITLLREVPLRYCGRCPYIIAGGALTLLLREVPLHYCGRCPYIIAGGALTLLLREVPLHYCGRFPYIIAGGALTLLREVPLRYCGRCPYVIAGGALTLFNVWLTQRPTTKCSHVMTRVLAVIWRYAYREYSQLLQFCQMNKRLRVNLQDVVVFQVPEVETSNIILHGRLCWVPCILRSKTQANVRPMEFLVSGSGFEIHLFYLKVHVYRTHQ